MFTGIVTHVAAARQKIKTNDGLTLSIKKPAKWDDIELGESIATDGACLTITEIRDDEYDVYLVPETLSKTTFGQKLPNEVNLERSLSASALFGGHFVQGHIDEVGIVSRIGKTNGYRIEVSFSNKFAHLVVPKGSIAINGVSLTVVDAGDQSFSVALIPHTVEHTTLGGLEDGDPVNLEFDMIGKYIAKNLKAYERRGKAEN